MRAGGPPEFTGDRERKTIPSGGHSARGEEGNETRVGMARAARAGVLG